MNANIAHSETRWQLIIRISRHNLVVDFSDVYVKLQRLSDWNKELFDEEAHERLNPRSDRQRNGPVNVRIGYRALDEVGTSHVELT